MCTLALLHVESVNTPVLCHHWSEHYHVNTRVSCEHSLECYCVNTRVSVRQRHTVLLDTGGVLFSKCTGRAYPLRVLRGAFLWCAVAAVS